MPKIACTLFTHSKSILYILKYIEFTQIKTIAKSLNSNVGKYAFQFTQKRTHTKMAVF